MVMKVATGILVASLCMPGVAHSQALAQPSFAPLTATTILQIEPQTAPADETIAPESTVAFVSQIADQNASTIMKGEIATGAALIDQSGERGTSVVNQSGSDNHARLTQLAGSGSARSLIFQTGSRLQASVTQGGFANVSVINQTGSDNIAAVSQNAR